MRGIAMRAAVVAVFVWLAGCGVGEVPIGGGGTPDAGGGGGGGAASFNRDVAPLLTRCVVCHGGGQPPNLMSFDALQAKYKMKPGATNVFVTKGDATAGVHSGIAYFSAAEKQAVAAWIDSL
jgi:hypothetical protein